MWFGASLDTLFGALCALRDVEQDVVNQHHEHLAQEAVHDAIASSMRAYAQITKHLGNRGSARDGVGRARWQRVGAITGACPCDPWHVICLGRSEPLFPRVQP